MTTSIDFRTCPLCEATCGLEVTHQEEKIVRIRGDRDDVFSHGFICPKGSTLGKIDEDPDRVRTPLIKRDGIHEPATWDEAFALIESRLLPIIAEHGNSSVGVYLGNPNVHSMSGTLYPRVFLKMLGSKSIFSAATVDQMPKHVSSGLMFGHPDLIPVPDIDRTSYLLMLGANPYESNGSLATAPDWPGRLQAIRERGGKVVVVDPRWTRTADAADEHVFIRPGADALFLFALANVLFDEGLVDPGDLEAHVAGIEELAAAVEPFTPEEVADSDWRRPGPDPAAGTRARRRRLGRCLRPDRHSHRRVRDDGVLDGRRPQCPHREPGPTGRGNVLLRRPRAAEIAPRVPGGEMAESGQGTPRGKGRAPGVDDG